MPKLGSCMTQDEGRITQSHERPEGTDESGDSSLWGVIKIAGGGTEMGTAGRTGVRPIEIAQRRYAGGEITREQFDQIKRDLSER